MRRSAFVQIFTGGYRGGQVSFSEVRTALDTLPAKMELSGVIMGWAPDKAVYRQTLSFLAKRGVPLYLWLPVFSETSALETCDPLIGMDGRPLRSINSTENENFDFCCPGSLRNAENVRNIFRRHFAEIGFDGVFLDKIRYPSPANPPWSWRVCFCQSCLEQYRRHGLSTEEILLAAMRLPEAQAPFTALDYSNGVYHLDHLPWERFFKARSDIVTASVTALANWFRAEGYRVGLDVFAPFLSPFVGQDLEALSSGCDWMKPMMYRNTNAPAGLPFEISALCREGCPNHTESWYTAMACDGRGAPDSVFLRKDLEALTDRSACPIYPGLEVNRIPQVADIFPEDVRQAFEILPENTKSVVLSWNLMRAPGDNVSAAAEVLQGF